MRLMLFLPALFLAAGLIAAPQKKISRAAQTAIQKLHALFAAEWEYELREYPEFATGLGDRRYNDRWMDWSLEAVYRRQQHEKEVLRRLETIKRDLLPAEEQLNHDLFQYQYRMRVEGHPYFTGVHLGWGQTYLMPVNQLTGPQIDIPQVVNATPFEKAVDYRKYLKRLEKLPAVLDQTIVLLKEGLAEGWTPPRVTLAEVPNQIKSLMRDDWPKNPLYKPFLKFPADINPAVQEEIRSRAEKILRKQVIPAYQKLLEYFKDEYLPRTRQTDGAWALPDGPDFYRYRARYFTTTDLSPQEIHKIGLREVKRIRAEMKKIIKKTGFSGTIQEFARSLRKNPKFYYRTAEELLRGYRDIAKRIDPELVHLFGKLPRMPYGVRPIPAFQAPSSPAAYYNDPAPDGSRAGYFYANTYRLDTRPKFEMEALTLHEAVPGHHLQIALAQELEGLPNFRKHAGYTAYVEGWALYSEGLGYELGMYQDPYSQFGQLSYELWRAGRLVVDTGLHYLKWTRQQAIDYLKENTPTSEHEITVEVDRYIVWPGQALGYKIGQLKIMELRNLAQKELGERFDLKAFHDLVLSQGAVPLKMLEKMVRDYIKAAKTAK